MHAETECAAEVANTDQFHEVVKGGVDPAATLGEEDGQRGGDDCFADCLGTEHHFSVREVSKH